MPSTLNFARAPFRNDRLAGLVYFLLAAGLVAATSIHAVVLTRHLLREQEDLDLKVQALEKELAGLETEVSRAREEVASPRSVRMEERVGFLAGLFRRKGFSWTGFFNELESICPPNVRITSITPTEERGIIKVSLSVVGRSLEDILEMVRRLGASQLFGSVLPLDEGQEDPRRGEGLAVTLTLRYLPGRSSPPPRPKPAGS